MCFKVTFYKRQIASYKVSKPYAAKLTASARASIYQCQQLGERISDGVLLVILQYRGGKRTRRKQISSFAKDACSYQRPNRWCWPSRVKCIKQY
jgi:hypothetical protein